MLRFLRSTFSHTPQLEVGARVLYWRVSFIQDLVKRILIHRRARLPIKQENKALEPVSLEELESTIRSHGIGPGDILIVHSSMQSLAPTGASPEQIIKLLRLIIGDGGTLVMPAIPKYREASTGTERITRDLSEEVWIYDVQRTPPWTGSLPHKLMKTAGAIRSRFPLNTVVALGKHAEEMTEHELDTPGATPCGPQSAWAYCAEHGAKILMLGVDVAHSLTMIHVAEDCHEDTWPVAGWYRPRRFLIKDMGSTKEVSVRERHPKWAMHYGERKLNADLFAHEIAKQTMLGDLSVTTLHARELMSFLGSRRTSGYPYFLWKFTH